MRRTLAVLALLCATATPAAAGTLTGTVRGAGASAAAVVVVAAPRDGVLPPAPVDRPHATMDQKHLAFRPRVLAVQRGSVVDFINSDDVEHNVFSPSVEAGEFDLGTYGHNESREVRFERTGEVRVLCNVHMEMEAHIVVVDSPWFAVTDAQGRFAIRDLPAGEYVLTLWNDGWLDGRWPVTVAAEGESRLDLEAP